MFEPLIVAAALAVPSDTDREWAVQRPNRGGASRYMDSNVQEVWEGVPAEARRIWLCIRNHESRHSGHYTAENPVSTASGAGQWLNGTWDGLKEWVKVNGKFVAKQYDEAKDAPAWVQDAAFIHVWKRDGLSMWHGTWCPGT
jgi:hypothetical protein